jgi:hypothetical protein
MISNSTIAMRMWIERNMAKRARGAPALEQHDPAPTAG